MNYYRYKIIESGGRISKGVIKLPYKEPMSAISYFERSGHMVIFVKKVPSYLTFYYKLLSLRTRKKITRPQLAEFLYNTALMLKAGIPLITALEESGANPDQPELKDDVMDIIQRIQGGMSFSETVTHYKHIFPETVAFLIRMGEETGQLDQMMENAAEHLNRIQTIISDTKQALMYPAFVFVAMGGGIIFWFYFVVPKIISLFKEMGVVLPPITLFIMNISIWVQNYILLLISGGVAVFFIYSWGRKFSIPFKRLTDRILLKLPVVGLILNASILAFITEYLAMLLNAGIEVFQSITILSESMKNEIYKDKLKMILEVIQKGETIGDAFKQTELFPSFVVRMISVGEMSGTLTEQLGFVSVEYSKKLSILVSTIGKMIEPFVLITAGCIFGLVFGALLLPIYDLIGTITG